MMANLIGRLFEAMRPTLQPQAAMTSKDLLDTYADESSVGAQVSPTTAMQQATVYACVRILSESIAQLPFEVYRREGDAARPATEHSLYRILHDQPNEFETSFESREGSVTELNLRGNSYYLKITSQARRQIEELIPLPPDSVHVERGPDLRPTYQVSNSSRYFRGGVTAGKYSADEVWHIRGLSRDRLTGLSPIMVQRDLIGLGIEQSDLSGRMAKNGQKGTGLLTTPPFKDDEARDRFRRQFDASASGANAGKTIILEQTEGEYKQLSMTSEDAQFLESQKMTRSQIAAIFRVPPHMVADLEKATFSNIEQQSLEFVTYSLLPWCRRIEQSANMHLLTTEERASGYYCKFNLSGLLRGDTAARAAYYKTMMETGAFTANKILRLEDMNPRTDDGGDRYYVTNNVQPSDGSTMGVDDAAA